MKGITTKKKKINRKITRRLATNLTIPSTPPHHSVIAMVTTTAVATAATITTK